MADPLTSRGVSLRTLVLTIVLTVLACFVIGFAWWQTATHWREHALRCTTCRGAVDAIMLRYHWEKLETQQDTRPFVSTLGKNLENQSYSWDFLRRGQRDSQRPLDEFERATLAEFERQKGTSDGATALSATRVVSTPKGASTFEYYQPIFAKEQCLHCHNLLANPDVPNSGMQVGELMAVVKVELPLMPGH